MAKICNTKIYDQNLRHAEWEYKNVSLNFFKRKKKTEVGNH